MSIDRLRRFIGDMTSLTGGAWQDKDEKAIVEVGAKLLGELCRHDDWLPEQAARVPAHGYAQKRCLPICTISGRDQIHLLVAVTGLK